MSELRSLSSTAQLHNGVEMPYLGLGTMGIHDAETIAFAIDAGYRLLDTAMIYKNEGAVGEGVRRSSVERENLFITSKVWNTDQGYDTALQAFDDSLQRLGTDYLDLYLVHWPTAGKYTETWRALETLYTGGRVKAIGVSNFMRHHLEDLLSGAEVVPMVNQMEFHPYLVQQDQVDFNAENGILYQAWSPLMSGQVVTVKQLRRLAGEYGRTIAQIVLRWSLQKGVLSIPKASSRERIMENAALFDFTLTEEDIALIDALDRGQRVGPDPDNFDF